MESLQGPSNAMTGTTLMATAAPRPVYGKACAVARLTAWHVMTEMHARPRMRVPLAPAQQELQQLVTTAMSAPPMHAIPCSDVHLAR